MNKITKLTATFLVLFMDQLTKLVIVKYFPDIRIEITSFFNISLVYNKGISFGMFNDISYSNYIFAIIASVIVVFLIKWLLNSKSKLEAIALCLIIGGAIGNIIDRIIYIGVVDFLEFHYKEYYWPSFNIADSTICLGVCILLIFSINCENHKDSRK